MKNRFSKHKKYVTDLSKAELLDKQERVLSVNTMELFMDDQFLLLSQNARLHHGKNLKPVAYLRIRELGYRFLLTEANFKSPNSSYGYGLYDYDTRIGIGFIDLAKLTLTAKAYNDSLIVKKDFEADYNLAVYALIADNLKTLVTDDSVTGYKNYFENFGTKVNCDNSQDLSVFRFSNSFRFSSDLDSDNLFQPV